LHVIRQHWRRRWQIG